MRIDLGDNRAYLNRMAKPVGYRFSVKLSPIILGELTHTRIPFTSLHNFTITVYLRHIPEGDPSDLLELIWTHEWLHFLLLRDGPDHVVSRETIRGQEAAIIELTKKGDYAPTLCIRALASHPRTSA